MDHDRPTARGTREELVKDLRDMSSGCLARDETRREAAAGADLLESGETSVQVGHTTYSVTD